jgi:hypothetical protein
LFWISCHYSRQNILYSFPEQCYSHTKLFLNLSPQSPNCCSLWIHIHVHSNPIVQWCVLTMALVQVNILNRWFIMVKDFNIVHFILQPLHHSTATLLREISLLSVSFKVNGENIDWSIPLFEWNEIIKSK